MIQDHVTVRDRLWFKTGGVADYLAVCQKPSEIVEALSTALEQKIPYRIVGKGSKSLFSDSGFPGLLIQNQTDGIVFMHDRSQVIVDSGVTLETLIHRAASLGYGGLEHFYGLPGTIGGALFINLGVGDHTLGQYLRSATILSQEKQRVSARRVSRDWFKFAPYSSLLWEESKKEPMKNFPIILSATFQLSRTSHEACLHRIRQLAKDEELAKTGAQKFLRVFTNLTTQSRNWLGHRSKSSNPDAALCVTRQQIRQWQSGDVTICENNPNFFVNTGVGTSRDAARLIARIKSELSSDEKNVMPVVSFIGLWEENELS